MNCLRIFSDASGESHFDEVDITLASTNFAPPAPPFLVSEPAAAERLLFLKFPRNWFGDWHPTPTHQYFVLLAGLLEAEVSDGDVRRVEPGTVVLLEDTSGRGHVTRVLGETEAEGMFVQLP